MKFWLNHVLLPGQFLYRWIGILLHPPRAFRYEVMQAKFFWKRRFHCKLAFHWCETQVSDYPTSHPFCNNIVPDPSKLGLLNFQSVDLFQFLKRKEPCTPYWGHPIPLYRIQSLQSLGGSTLVVSIWCKYPLWFLYLSRPIILIFAAWDMLGLL